MHEKAKFIFYTTSILFGAVLVFATYIGVYLTYIAIPVILLSGLIMKCTRPNLPLKTEQEKKPKSAINEFIYQSTEVAEKGLNILNSFLGEINHELQIYNNERQKDLKQKEAELGKEQRDEILRRVRGNCNKTKD